MNITLRHTEYLLTAHPCVVIDGFGAVLRRRRPARYDDAGRILPPDYVYAFNPDITIGDGLLASSIARAEEVTPLRAATLIQADVEAMRRQLAADGTLTLGRIGTLVADSDGRILFRNYNADGLTPLASWLPVVPVPVSETRHADTDVQDAEFVPHRHVRLRRMLRAAAAVAIVAATAIVTSTPITVSNANYASTSMPAVTAPRPAYVPSSAPIRLNLVYDGNGAIAVDTAARAEYQARFASAAAAETVRTTPDAPRLNETDPYVVIIASLTNRRDAETCVAQNRARFGGNYGILSNADGTRFRVYAATAASLDSARAALNRQDIRRFEGAWYMHR